MTEKPDKKRKTAGAHSPDGDVAEQLRKMIRKLPRPVQHTRLDCVGSEGCKIGLPQVLPPGP